jgi:flagellar biosynthesis protein FlhF
MNTSPPNPTVQVIPFIAESAQDAVAQIRAKLGPEAVVVNVRQLPADGLAKLWKSPRIEVLAYKPDLETRNAEPGTRSPDPLSELKQELQAIRQQLASANVSAVTDAAGRQMNGPAGRRANGPARSAGVPSWRVGDVLEISGLMPLHAQQVMERLQTAHGEIPPASLAEELVLARKALSGCWRNAVESGGDRLPHVLVGPAGAGKTTCICKWLAQARLIDGRSAHVWRLDGSAANTAEALSVYCEILDVPSERTWNGMEGLNAELKFIDLPGVDWRNSGAIHDLRRVLETVGPCRIHLVLNAAYEVPLLLAQARAFSALPIDDLILTHLDEEPRWGKIWNVVLGTNYPVRFLSAAQNVPGEFLTATPERILTRQFPA